MLQEVREIIAEELSIDVEEIKLESTLSDDLGADSLDAVELVMAIEDAFDVEISDEVATKIKTVQDIVTLLEELK